MPEMKRTAVQEQEQEQNDDTKAKWQRPEVQPEAESEPGLAPEEKCEGAGAVGPVAPAALWTTVDLSLPDPVRDLPSQAEFVILRGPGSICLFGKYSHVKALLITNDVDVNCINAKFPCLTHLAALNMSHCSASHVIKNNWILPKNFPALTHCYTDGCAPLLNDYCMRNHAALAFRASSGKTTLECSKVFEALDGFHVNVLPEVPCHIVFPLTRRMSGLGPERAVFQGSDKGWIVTVDLSQAPEHVVGKHLQLFYYQKAECTITKAMEEDRKEFNLRCMPQLHHSCELASRVSWEYLLQKREDDGPTMVPAETHSYATIINRVTVNGSEIDAARQVPAMLKAVYEICGPYFLSSVDSQLGLTSADNSQEEHADKSCFNPNLKFEFTTEELNLLRSKMLDEFTSSVESQYFAT
jgi:hypothetical protein